MLEQILLIAISSVTATIGAVFGGFIISKRLKSDLKTEFYEFINGEEAPKLFYAIGSTLGAGAMSRLGSANPMKGNINIMGMKIPKVLAFGFAQKMGWLPKNMGMGEGPPTSPDIPEILKEMK